MTMMSTGTDEALTSEEIASQPQTWSRALDERAAALRVLPPAGVAVLALGCGTSYYMGESWSRARNAAGGGRTRALIASEIPYVDPDETVVALSRSGTTGDLLRAVEQLRRSHRVVGIVGAPGTPLTELCDETILLPYADERSVVQTRFATTALTLLRASTSEDLSGLVDDALAALEAPLPELPDHIVFLGTGWAVGLAHEAALKCREAAGAWSEAYPVREYQHGPIAVAGHGSLVWSFSPLPDTVRAPIEATGARVLESSLDPQAQLVMAQRLAVALAQRAGRDPDHPRHLARSVQG